MDDDIGKFAISPEDWKVIEPALRATGTLVLAEAYERLKLFEEKLTGKVGGPLKAFLQWYDNHKADVPALHNLILSALKTTWTDLPRETFAAEFKLKSNSPSAMKHMGKDLKTVAAELARTGVIKAREEKVTVIKTEWISPFKSKVTGEGAANADEATVFENALAALSSGEFESLDPVSGDASCEMRVPFLLDVRDNLSSGSANPVTVIDNICPFADKDRGGNKKQKRSASRYFGVCHPLTTMRRQAKDNFLFLIDDNPTKFAYSFNVREALKSDLAEYNVEYMQALAKQHVSLAPTTTGATSMELMISNMFNICKIDMSKGGQTQPLLPIFTAMRLILMHEIRKGRPITITISRIGYGKDKYTHVTGFKHCGSEVLFYRPENGKYVYVPEDELKDDEKTVGLTNIHTYNMFRLDGSLPLWCSKEEAFFFSSDWSEFLKGFTSCDTTHLLRVWAAAHPPVPKASRLWQDKEDLSFRDSESYSVPKQTVTVTNADGVLLSTFDIDEYIDKDSYNAMRGQAIRRYVEACHIQACPQHAEKSNGYKLPPMSLCCAGINLFDLTSDEMDLASEYQYYQALAHERDLFEIHYADEFVPEESSYELDQGNGLTIVSKSEYDKNTTANKRRSSRATTVRKFQRVCGNIAFSPVHLFLSSYGKEKSQLGAIRNDWTAGHMTLSFVEEEIIDSNSSAVNNRSYWKVEEYKLDKFELDMGM